MVSVKVCFFRNVLLKIGNEGFGRFGDLFIAFRSFVFACLSVFYCFLCYCVYLFCVCLFVFVPRPSALLKTGAGGRGESEDFFSFVFVYLSAI